ncbi:hypothetical protein C1645_836446 [Glomus cerebriforme]|uniref:hAT-like transposase RNase-H fold domain-containing protein n=1 Tax=Glomus cerebriforme TaxID=658196 RepID=A0A397S5V0_9GLOM|nr:hypothetical protein C1645_836446 [Glomus cerebriforme]
MREALDATASSDKELQNFELTDDEWSIIEEIVSVLMVNICTYYQYMSSAKYPMLSTVVPLYNYLIDELEDYCDCNNSSHEIVTAVKAGINKLERYYIKTDDTTMYTIATGYYEDHKWKPNFVRFAKETAINIYNTKYGPPEYLENDSIEFENNAFFNHIFGKQQKVQQNEVDLYLKAPRAEPQQDILL